MDAMATKIETSSFSVMTADPPEALLQVLFEHPRFPAFGYSRTGIVGNKQVASQSTPTWNRIISWLKETETLRKAVA